MAVVYQHRRNDNNEVFYIGIGNDVFRAGRTANRNKEWYKIKKEFGFNYEILISGISRKDAFDIEKGLIEYYGRKDMKKGNLVNQTRGGDGCPSKENPYPDTYYTKHELRELIKKSHPRW